MRSALSDIDGVEGVEVDFGAKTATITWAGDCDPEALVGALEGTRFSAEVAE